MKRPTIRDVAARAQVSHQTVSRVINGDKSVVPATYERVLAAVRELNYVPNAIARSLSSRRTKTIGLVGPSMASPAIGSVVAGAEAAAYKGGFFLIVGNAELAAEVEPHGYLEVMLRQRVEGIILAWPPVHPDHEQLERLAISQVPIVSIAFHPELPGITVVDVDNRQGAFDATTYLIQKGHRSIATLVGPPMAITGSLQYTPAVARLTGYKNALYTHGIPDDPTLIQRSAGWKVEEGRSATARLFDAERSFTAIFAQSDMLALGAIAEVQARGMRVPDDVAVVGFGDESFASFVNPPLTTVYQPLRELGALAVELLIDELNHAAEPGRDMRDPYLLPTQLVTRQSG